MVNKTTIFWTGILLVFASVGHAQKDHLPKYDFTTISSSNGISSVEISKLFQDTYGFIWLGTSAGISKYDGADFENYMYAGGELISNIYDIIEGNDGFIWAAGLNGLYYFDGREFVATSISKIVIYTLMIDQEGNLLIGGDGFIPIKISPVDQENLRKGQEIQKEKLIDITFWEEQLSNTRTWEITEDDEGNIWIGIDNTLGRIVNDTLLTIWTSENENAWVSDIIAINPDSVYWSGESLGLRLKAGKSIDLIMNVYVGISSRSDTTLTFLTTKDLIRIGDGLRDTLSDLEGFDHLYFRAMLEDIEGNIWIAAEGSLFKLTAKYFKSWTIKDLELLYSNHSITQLESGEILLGSSKENILEWNGNSIRIQKKIPVSYNSVTEGILKDKNGNFWYATSMSGLLLFKDGKFQHFDESSGLLDKTVLFVKEDQFGRLWSGGETGISQIEINGSDVIIKNYSDINSRDETLKFSNVVCKSKNECYAISNNAIYRVGRRNLEIVDIIHGGEKPIISNALSDRQGGLLVSTIGQGLLQIQLNDLGKFEIVKKWNQERGLLSNIILNFHLDKKNRIWTFSQNGTCVIQSKSKKDEIRCYDENDGWKPLASTHIDLLESDDEIMWLVANSTVTKFPLYGMPVNTIKPQTFIKNVKLFEGREDVSKYELEDSQDKSSHKLALPYNKNFLEFNFVSTSYTHNEKNQFSYKLEGLDESWSKPSSSTKVSYPGLKPGSYIFKVFAINNSGIRGDLSASYSFKVFSPWYLTRLAYLIYILLISSVLYIFYKLQLNKKRKEDEAHKLKELNEFQSQFYTNITHEFRTPLTVILGMIEKLAGELEIKQDSGARQELEMIERNANNLLKLVNEMLDMSMLENGSMKLEFVQADVCSFIKYILESLKSFASLKGVDLICYSEVQKLMMDFDEEKMAAIISNLVTNAIKFSDAGDQIIVHLKSELENEGIFFYIKVKDEGQGIDEENLPHIFDRFYTSTDDTNLSGIGSGVGLALCKELINLMSGKISVKSEIGVGTEFLVRIPITNKARISNSEVKKRMLPLMTTGISPNLKSSPQKLKEHKELALIIEDNTDVATYLMSCLEGKYQTIHAVDGEEGVKMAIEHQPDIVISDVMMPKKNGFEVCEHLKNDISTDHIPIILLTARVNAKDRLTGFSHGADAYLTKPFSKAELFTRIDQLILGRKKILDKLSKSGIEAFMRKKLVDPDALFIQKSIKIIKENIGNSIFGPPLLAKKLRLSESQVYRKLKSISGKSTAIFIRSIRLQKAKELLQEPEMNISEVAYEVGFTNPSWFSTAFKEEFGFSPSDLK